MHFQGLNSYLFHHTTAPQPTTPPGQAVTMECLDGLNYKRVQYWTESAHVTVTSVKCHGLLTGPHVKTGKMN